MGGGMDLGGGIDDLGGPEGGDVGGEEETMDMGSAPEADAGEPVSESKKKKNKIITEILTYGKPKNSFFDEYMKKINEGAQNEENSLGRVEMVSDNFIINEELTSVVNKLDSFLESGGELESGNILTE
jgi:hypothetical protein